jgi:hypothetical protein
MSFKRQKQEKRMVVHVILNKWEKEEEKERRNRKT